MKPINEHAKKTTPRREFLKTFALLGGSAVVMSQLEWAQSIVTKAQAGTLSPAESYELSRAENILSTLCLQCNTGCGIKVKPLNGVAVKIDGNPYSPWTLVSNIPDTTPLKESVPIEGALCPKGQSGIQTLYDPYRIVKVLKRAGKRGEGKWQTIPFEQAVKESVENGKLFKHVKGEENRHVEGLKDLWHCATRRSPKQWLPRSRTYERRRRLKRRRLRSRHSKSSSPIILVC